MNWHQIEIKEVLQLTKSTEQGLSAAEAEKRLEQYGFNEITQARSRPPWIIFMNQFKDFMILVLIGTAVISGLLSDLTDTIVIIAIVLLNAVVGFIQEYRAEKAIETLRKMTVTHSRVLRNNTVTSVSSTRLVPGDIVLLETGNIVPADIRLAEAAGLKANESSLTGESEPSGKQTTRLEEADLPLGDYSNMVFKGTHITNGHARGVVVATGMNTELGRIARMLQVPGLQTPLQRRLLAFGKNLAYIVFFICAVVFGVGYLRGEDVVLMLLTALSLAVAAIPEALPAVITIALALGARKMIRKNVLIRKLPAVETLGSVTYICTDKTGTLTLNRMSVEGVAGTGFVIHKKNGITGDAGGDPYRQLMKAMALNSDVQMDEEHRFIGDPTETALYEFAAAEGYHKAELENRYPRVAEIPFDSKRKCMSTIHRHNGKYIVYVKGAMEVLMQKTSHHETANSWERPMNDMLTGGLRVLGFATRELEALPDDITPETIENNLSLIGIAGIIDPPREEARKAVQECKTAGIKAVMITGDHPVTAATIAKRLGIMQSDEDRILTGAELKKLSPEELVEIVDDVKVYARVSPEQKLHIVKAMQQRGELVAMTGDGVNDAPALKHADIGVAMGINGTDVSKEASSMILLDDNFATIVGAVKEGRRIFDNIRKFIRYVLTGNSAEIWTIFLAPFFALPIPLLPIHILWINLVTDGLPGLALAAEPAEKKIMKRPPRHPGQSIFADGLGIHVLWVGLLLAALTIGIQAWAIHNHHPNWQTMVFTVLCLGQLMHVMAIRSEFDSLFRQGIFSNRPLVVAVAGTFLLQVAIIYLPFFNEVFKTKPLTITELLTCIAISMTVFIAVEMEKLVSRSRRTGK